MAISGSVCQISCTEKKRRCSSKQLNRLLVAAILLLGLTYLLFYLNIYNRLNTKVLYSFFHDSPVAQVSLRDTEVEGRSMPGNCSGERCSNNTKGVLTALNGKQGPKLSSSDHLHNIAPKQVVRHATTVPSHVTKRLEVPKMDNRSKKRLDVSKVDKRTTKGLNVSKEDDRTTKRPDVLKVDKRTAKGLDVLKLDDRTTNRTNSSVKAEKSTMRYIVYVCDGNFYCYGWGDRQRAIISLYYLAIVTGRTLIINMTSPWPLTHYYKPAGKVDWVPSDELLRGKSSATLKLFGSAPFPWEKVDFNEHCPQDVIYFNTNQNFFANLRKNPLYNSKLPNGQRWQVHSKAWLSMMHPTQELRSELNDLLINISLAQDTERTAYSTSYNPGACLKSSCAAKNTFRKRDFNESKCLDAAEFQSGTSNVSGMGVVNGMDLCRFPPPEVKAGVTATELGRLQGHELAKLNLVCVHVRMGKSETLKGERNVRNRMENLPALWKFLRAYVDKGHHVYIATDSQRVREIAKSQFAHRVHFSTVKITHSSLPEEKEVARKGFKLALTEQLLLSTSCRVLVISKSGFSVRAAMVRRNLQGEEGLFIFRYGSVVPFGSYHLF